MAAGSLKRINKFALGEARGHKKFFIIANIILGMGGLLYTFMSSLELVYDHGDGALNWAYWEPSVLGVFLLVVGGGIGLMGASSIFRDMNNRQLGDVQLSLPMTANERYMSKLLALCYIHILPVIVWAGVPSVINALRCAAAGGEARNSEYLPLIFLAILAGTLFVDCITVLCTVCCGAMAEGVYFMIITAICLSAAPALIWYTLTSTCAGQSTDAGLVFSAWTLSFVLNVFNPDDVHPVNCMLMLNCVISAIVLLLTLFIYRRRDARSIGTPIVNRTFFECVMFGGLTTVYGIFFFRSEAYIGVIIVGIIYMVIHIITSRGKLSAKKFAGWIGKFALSTAAYIILSWTAYVSGGFGLVHYMPSETFIDPKMEIEIRSIDRDVDMCFNGDYKTAITEEQARQAAKVFQKYASNHEKSFGEFIDALISGYSYNESGDLCYMNISYRTAAGNRYIEHMEQDARLTLSESQEMLKELEALGMENVRDDSMMWGYDDVVY